MHQLVSEPRKHGRRSFFWSSPCRNGTSRPSTVSYQVQAACPLPQDSAEIPSSLHIRSCWAVPCRAVARQAKPAEAAAAMSPKDDAWAANHLRLADRSSRWPIGVWLGRGTPPCLQSGRPGLLLSQELLGELADREQAAFPALNGGELGPGAIPGKHDLDEGQIQGSPVQLGQPLQVASLEGVARLVAVAVGGEPALGQPLQEPGRLRLVVPVDVVGNSDQHWIGEPGAGEVGDGGALEQVGDHVLGEPDIGLVIDQWLVAGVGGGTASRQDGEDQPTSKPSPHPPPLGVAYLPRQAAMPASH